MNGPASLLVVLAVFAVTACATPRGAPGALSDVRPAQRPTLDSDEAGLWMQMDRVEQGLRTSGHLVTDTAVRTYLRDILCKLATDYCPDIRLYVVQTPHFNASMAPNGVMQVWTGLLLRADNEAQLAYVLGHELGHYLRRHSVQRWRDVRTKTNVTAVFTVLTAAAGHGYIGSLAQLVALGSIMQFSRDNEREADEIGFELMVRAGYDPREASKVWESLDKERRAGKDSDPLIFFATHPPTDERIDTLKELARKTYTPDRDWTDGRQAYLKAVRPLRATLLRDELRLRDFARTQVLLARLVAAEPASGQLHFFQGELYRLRNDDGDPARALESYERALATGGAPPETNRAAGLLLMRRGEKDRARAAFDRYLTEAPDAEDKSMIHAYLEQLR
ncbi:MAG: M48 family metalloprotease [Candidatus Rokuibacteriota bacterium]